MPEELIDEGMDTIARHTCTRKRQPKAISELWYLISHPSKLILRVILNRLKVKVEELLAENQKQNQKKQVLDKAGAQ